MGNYGRIKEIVRAIPTIEKSINASISSFVYLSIIEHPHQAIFPELMELPRETLSQIQEPMRAFLALIVDDSKFPFIDMHFWKAILASPRLHFLKNALALIPDDPHIKKDIARKGFNSDIDWTTHDDGRFDLVLNTFGVELFNGGDLVQEKNGEISNLKQSFLHWKLNERQSSIVIKKILEQSSAYPSLAKFISNLTTGKQKAPQAEVEQRLVFFFSVAQASRITALNYLRRGVSFDGIRNLIAAYSVRSSSIIHLDPRTIKPLLAHVTRFLPTLLFELMPEDVATLVRPIEGINDSAGNIGFHPHEAELLALISHPKDPQRKGPHIAPLSLALTSINRLVGIIGRRTPGELLEIWSRIGRLTFSFRLWKYDTRRLIDRAPNGQTEYLAPALIEHFGFQPIEGIPSDATYGRQFVLRKDRPLRYWSTTWGSSREGRQLSSEFEIILRRGYLLCCHELHGTLLVRNSSLVFGRDLFMHPAYWRKTALTVNEMINFSGEPERQGFYHILDRRAYEDTRSFPRHLDALSDALLAVKEAYSSFKYDTRVETAWSRSRGKGSTLMGGHHSSGFAALVDMVERMYLLQSEGRLGFPMPELTFVDPAFPPWGELLFKDVDGRPTTRLKVNEEVVEGLKKMASGSFSDEDINYSSVREFLQEAGLNQGGEIMLVDPGEKI